MNRISLGVCKQQRKKKKYRETVVKSFHHLTRHTKEGSQDEEEAGVEVKSSMNLAPSSPLLGTALIGDISIFNVFCLILVFCGLWGNSQRWLSTAYYLFTSSRTPRRRPLDDDEVEEG